MHGNKTQAIGAALGHQLKELWAKTSGDSRITIAVLDGPVDRTHSCFSGAGLRESTSLVSPEADDGMASRHGTHVASVIFGQHPGPVAGVAPGCRGLIVPVFSDGPKGSVAPCSQLDLARAITQAVQDGASIVNISGGQLEAGGEAHEWLARAIRLCAQENVLIVAAAGNEGCECLYVPACIPSVLAVGASDESGTPLERSNWGPSYRTQGILAPGMGIPGAVPGGGTTTSSGTSFATPIVAGVAGLLLSLQLQRGDRPDPMAVRQALLRSTVPCDPLSMGDCRRFLAGQLNIAGAADFIENGSRAAVPHGSAASDNGSLVVPAASSEDMQLTCVVGSAGLPLQECSNGSKETDRSLSSTKTEGMHTAEAVFRQGHPTIKERMRQTMQNEEVTVTENQRSEGDAAAIPDVDLSVSSQQTSEQLQLAVMPSAEMTSPGGVAGPSAPEQGHVVPSDCGCGGSCGGAQHPALVYALGQIGHDFGMEARRDSFLQHGVGNPDDPRELLAHLSKHPSHAAAATWILSQETTPIYAVRPSGPFAAEAFAHLRKAYKGQLKEGVERVSIPGLVSGKATLFNGQVVPVIVPEPRGLCCWSTEQLLKEVVGDRTDKGSAEERAQFEEKASGLRNFLDRVYYELRNMGLTPQERAINYAATNAFQAESVFAHASGLDMNLDNIEVEKSPICRPGSDCWDVKLSFFNPGKRLEQARLLYRFTVDVSDIVPVTVGTVRTWHVY